MIPTFQSGAAHAILRQEDCGGVQQGRAHRLDAKRNKTNSQVGLDAKKQTKYGSIAS
jgi:hypothetical protein